MNVCDYIINALYNNGIDTYFVITGGAIVPFINAIANNPKVKYYCFQHEQSAAMAAEGYYRSSGKIACVAVTSGPGVQNLLNGVCGCWYDSIPAFFITGQVNTAEDLSNFSSKPRQTGFQEMPVSELFGHVTKKSLHVETVDTIRNTLETLLSELIKPRFGPVLMDLPVNIQMSNMPKDTPNPSLHFLWPTKSDTKYDLTPFITESKRPLIIFGHGVKLAGVKNEAIGFAESTNIPFVVSWGAFDICETDHPLRIGSHGVYGDRCANYTVQNADLLIIIGSRLDSRQTGGNGSLFSKYSKKVMVDVDLNEIKKLPERNIHIDHSICTDLKEFFLNLKNSPIQTQFTEWKNTLNDWKTIYGEEITRKGDSAVYDYLNEFFRTLPDNSIVIPDQGGNLVWTMQSAKIKNNHKLFTNYGNSSMGFALPCAIGAAIGTPNKKVFCIDGDGGFQMNIQELLTVKKYNLNIDIIILNNNGYGIIKQFQDSYFDSKYIATDKSEVFGDEVNFVKIAEAYGVKTLTDVPIPETQKIYPKLEFGNSLENMTPYIDFECDMIVDVPPKKSLGWN